jgi:hypothetical protein
MMKTNIKMKTFIKSLFLMLLLMVAVNGATFASTLPVAAKELSMTERQARIDRIFEIRAMDKSHMTRKEKRELKHEKMKMEEELEGRRGGGGIYISVGAVIVVLLLIIILR